MFLRQHTNFEVGTEHPNILCVGIYAPIGLGEGGTGKPSTAMHF